MFGLFLADRLDGAACPGGADPDRVVQVLARAPARPGADAATAVGASRSRCGRIWFRQLADGEKELPGWRSACSAYTCNPCSAETTAVDGTGTGTGTGFPPGRDRPSRTAVKPESSPRWK
jgi:hypothetical protein